MLQAKVTSKGQVTIPKVVRDIMKLSAGDKVEFLVTGNGDVLLQPVTKAVDDVFGKLHKPGQSARSIAEMDQGIRKRIPTGHTGFCLLCEGGFFRPFRPSDRPFCALFRV
ncbi:MAG: AbrB/MazE/SpoVT family DNA-binding domain-containing protein [bacterium]